MSEQPNRDPWIQELIDAYNGDTRMTDKQIRIVAAAVEVFAEKGYAAASTSDIARKAEVAEGTIFRHYKTKKDLLYAIVAPIMSKMLAPFVIRDFVKVLDAPHATPESFLRAVIENRIEFLKRNQPMVQILLQEIPFHPELRERFKQHVMPRVLEKIVPVIERFQREGQIRPMPPLTAVRLCASAVIGYLLPRYIMAPDADWDDRREIDETVEFLMRGLRP
jgi:AcrR family transcriptional regulator